MFIVCTNNYDNIEQNKQNVVAFYDLMFNQCEPEKAIQLFVGDVYIQHNPHVGDGAQAFIEYFLRMAKEYPGKIQGLVFWKVLPAKHELFADLTAQTKR